MRGIPVIVMDLLGWAGIALGTYALTVLPPWVTGDDWARNTITGVILGVVINLGSFLFLMLVSLLKKSGVSLEIISSVVDAAEEQFGKDSGKGTEKLDHAIALLEEKVKGYKLGFFANLGFRIFAKPLIRNLAPRIKALLYAVR